MSGRRGGGESPDSAFSSPSSSSDYEQSKSPPHWSSRKMDTPTISGLDTEQQKRSGSERDGDEEEEEEKRYEHSQKQQQQRQQQQQQQKKQRKYKPKHHHMEDEKVDSPFHSRSRSQSDSTESANTSHEGSVVSKPRSPYQSYHPYYEDRIAQVVQSEISSAPSDSLIDWASSSKRLHDRLLQPIGDTEMEESNPVIEEDNEIIPPLLLLPPSNDTETLKREEPVAVEMKNVSDVGSDLTELRVGDSATENKTNVVERMKYEAPEDPRNHIINVIINSPTGSVTLQSIREALQWDEQFAATNGTVLDYLQGYQSIFAVSPVDDRVTLRQPLQRTKGRRAIRGPRGYHAISSRIGSISYSYVANGFDVDALAAIYKRRGYEASLIFDVLHVSSQRVFDLFLFPYGVVVWWGLNRRDHWIVEDDFLSSGCSYVSEAIKERYSQKNIDELFPFWCSYESDEQYDSSSASTRKDALDRFATNLCFDHYLVPDVNPLRTQIMLTVSYSLGRTAVVDFFDSMTQKLQKQVLSIPSDIRGLLDYFSTRRQIAHLEGEIHLSIVAITALRDTPEFLWEMPWLDEYYELTEKHNSLDQLLSWYCAKSDALLQQLANIKTRHFRLFMLGSDVFLILLLVIDVCFIMLRFVLRLYFPLEEEIL
ncbi:protein of unknown function DUF155 [Trypanosoma melophagium]|uniref:protein of unknown function DUF155 n=1 Tax=Trypanosoma melophagium TaxID=715481 RepID=UPI00351A8324|nr:protein of unknown function DUF155 [Trypanosoma melophagium]